MSEAPLRIAIVGAGRLGMVHASLIQASPDATVAAVVDPDTKLRSQFESQGFDCPFVESVDALLEGSTVDAAFVCTPNVTHRPLVEACAAAGVHVFVEKPLAENLESAEAMVAAVKDRKLAHCVGYVYGYLPVFQHVRELLRGGLVGTIQRGRAHCYISEVFASRTGWYYDPAISGGGVLPNLGSHLLYLLDMYFGAIREVRARVLTQFSSVDDAASALLTFEGDVPVLVDMSWSTPGAQMLDLGVTIEGNEGMVIASKEEALIHRYKAGAGFPEGWSRVHLGDLPVEVDFDIAPHIGGEGFFLQDKDFVDCCRTGRQPQSSFFEALNVQRMIHGIYEASATGRAALFER